MGTGISRDHRCQTAVVITREDRPDYTSGPYY